MTPPTHAAMPDISADPFRERRRGMHRATLQLLGARFGFESESEELMRVVDWAFAGLPRHTLSARVPRLAVKLVLGGKAGCRNPAEPAPLATSSGVGFFCGASPTTSMAAVHPSGHAALVVVERELLRFPYHLRYELIELRCSHWRRGRRISCLCMRPVSGAADADCCSSGRAVRASRPQCCIARSQAWIRCRRIACS